MNVLAKIQEKQEMFDQLEAQITKLNQDIVNINNTKKQISDEMLRLQGEYRVFLELGIESGIIDKNGNPINQVPAAEPTAEIDPECLPIQTAEVTE
jgi:hypothetical protein